MARWLPAQNLSTPAMDRAFVASGPLTILISVQHTILLENPVSSRHWVFDFEVPGQAAGPEKIRLQVCVRDVNARQHDILEHAVDIASNWIEDDVADHHQTCHVRIVLEVFAVERDAVLPEALYDTANFPNTHAFEF